jgi:hypothetical protein
MLRLMQWRCLWLKLPICRVLRTWNSSTGWSIWIRSRRCWRRCWLAGWVRRQQTRFLNEEGTIKRRVSVVRRLVEFTNAYPWEWRPADGEAFIAHLQSGNRKRPIAMSTGRGYETTLALFMEFVTDRRYGWSRECAERFGQAPQQIFHEDNRVAHVTEYEGRRPGGAGSWPGT